jgi:hypothetical protein
MKYQPKLFLTTIPLLFLSFHLSAQPPRFNAGIIAGLNFAELEGNEITDYFGFNAGLLGTARLSDRHQVGMELLFSQNGEYVLPEYYPRITYGQVRLNHIELPVHIDWLIRSFKRGNFYDWNLNIGLAYTRLLSYAAENVDQMDVTDQIRYGKKEAFLIQAGTTYHFTNKIGLNLKATLPIRKEGLSWTLAARIIYMLDDKNKSTS